ncbi:MAG: hypothetical protein ABMA02_15305 [Saprospiraceae bacterium]
MKIKLFDDFYLLQRLDHLIRTRATGTPCDLADRLGTSKRDVCRIIADLREQGFPIGYDREGGTYYYKEPVKLDVSIAVGGKKLLSIQGGENKSNFFSPVPDFGTEGVDLCTNLSMVRERNQAANET